MIGTSISNPVTLLENTKKYLLAEYRRQQVRLNDNLTDLQSIVAYQAEIAEDVNRIDRALARLTTTVENDGQTVGG
jgi:ubiquinone biosynthesis protein UbiJ